MEQIHLPQALIRRMNVSSQPRISPFRYPGGKTRLTELVHLWLLSSGDTDTFIEPFAGGASVGVYVAAAELASNVILVEKDPSVYAVWKTILSKDCAWLCRRIESFQVTRTSVLELLSKKFSSFREIAFQTLVHNRVSRSGKMWNGAGLTQRGENDSGISSRWYPETLVNRIFYINSLKNKISVVHGCGLEFLEKRKQRGKTSLFVDPPYSITNSSVGKRLYRFNTVDHDKLFHILMSLNADFLLTHENNKETRKLVRSNKLDMIKLQMPTAQNRVGNELLIGHDIRYLIDWLKSNPSMYVNKRYSTNIPKL